MIFKRTNSIKRILVNKKIQDDSSKSIFRILEFVENGNSISLRKKYDNGIRRYMSIDMVLIEEKFLYLQKFEYNIFDKLIRVGSRNTILWYSKE